MLRYRAAPRAAISAPAVTAKPRSTDRRKRGFPKEIRVSQWTISRRGRGPRRSRVPSGLNFANLAALDERVEFVPFSVRQPDGISVLPDCYALVDDHDFGARPAKRAQAEFLRFYRNGLLDPLTVRSLQPVAATDSSPFWRHSHGT